jgi:drug/metabolite transporter superfamily protein YnfA
MLRKVILFFTSALIALTAGRAFWVWLGEKTTMKYVHIARSIIERRASLWYVGSKSEPRKKRRF